MAIHLIKLAVGVDSVAHLSQLQKRRLAESKTQGPARLRHFTRHAPKRADELKRDGSIYWVIRGAIQARQRIRDIETGLSRDGVPASAIVLDPKLVRTETRLHRAFQGWRYLKPDDVPPDARGTSTRAELPVALAQELRNLGLL